MKGSLYNIEKWPIGRDSGSRFSQHVVKNSGKSPAFHSPMLCMEESLLPITVSIVTSQAKVLPGG